MTLSTAEKYLAGRYEKAVDRNLNVEEVQAYLASKGINRSMTQVVADLDYYGFYGYAAGHPAPRKQSVQAYDRMVDKSGPARSRLHELARAYLSDVTAGGKPNDVHSE